MKQKLASPNISKGIQSIKSLLERFDNIMDMNTQPFYERPRYIFRGIHRYYDDADKPGNVTSKTDANKDSNSEHKHTIEDVKNGYIRSALAIRLVNTANHNDESGFIKANYINVLQSMIRDVKKHYPEQYTDEMCDLDILADLQHNGGATCLVDFSKSFLTALWFACSDNEDYKGYIYCYDIMGDMIKHNALTYVKKKDENKNIAELLTLTYSHTNITSDLESRFLIWEPSTRNNRIQRQDSIFIFGMEKFKVSNHTIKILEIQAEEKKHILYALRVLFNVTYKTIYNDSIGYATSNEKSKLVDSLRINNAYWHGYQNMIKGDFDTAADLLKLWEGEKYKDLVSEQKVELHFSMAVCFKNLYRHDKTHYFENAVIEYKRCLGVIKELLNQKSKTPDFDSNYYYKKATRSYNSIIDILYEAEKYDAAYEMCDVILKEINEGFLKPYKVQNDKGGERNLRDTICKITKIELFVLKTIKNYTEAFSVKKTDELRNELETLDLEINKSFFNEFEQFLLDFYHYILEVLLSKEGNSERSLPKMIEWRQKMENKKIKYDDYNFWNLRDLKKAIDFLDENKIKDDYIRKKKYNLQSITAYAISFRDIYEMQVVGRSKETI